jgi:hypothetical protein
MRGARPAGAQVVAGGVTGAAPAAGESPKTFTPGGEAVRCSAWLGRCTAKEFCAELPGTVEVRKKRGVI